MLELIRAVGSDGLTRAELIDRIEVKARKQANVDSNDRSAEKKSTASFNARARRIRRTGLIADPRESQLAD